MDAARSTVLLVDDDPSLLDLLEVVLSESFECVRAHDGEAAMEAMAEWRPDVVVLDIMMPGADGFEVLREIRTRPHLRGLPVVMLTASSSGDWHASSDRLGADVYMTKPYDPLELEEVVARLLEQTPEERWAERANRLAPLRPFEPEPVRENA